MSMIYDKEHEDFKHQLPCIDCNFRSICKFCDTMSPLTGIPDNFVITVSCTEKEKLEKLLKGEHIK